MRRSSPQRHGMPTRIVTRLALAAPSSASPEFADVRLSTGVRLRYLGQGNPAGRPLILLHGITDSWFSFSRVLPGISEAHRGKVPARVWRAALAGLLETERFIGLGGSRIPALLIWGERDGLFSRSEQEALVAALPIASLKVYRETGHAPHWERPKEVVRDLERFFRTAPS